MTYFEGKMLPIRFRQWFCSWPRWRSLHCSPHPELNFRGLLRERDGRRGERIYDREGKRREKWRKGMERKGSEYFVRTSVECAATITYLPKYIMLLSKRCMKN